MVVEILVVVIDSVVAVDTVVVDGTSTVVGTLIFVVTVIVDGNATTVLTYLANVSSTDRVYVMVIVENRVVLSLVLHIV